MLDGSVRQVEFYRTGLYHISRSMPDGLTGAAFIDVWPFSKSCDEGSDDWSPGVM
jgi:hypothetical protein